MHFKICDSHKYNIVNRIYVTQNLSNTEHIKIFSKHGDHRDGLIGPCGDNGLQGYTGSMGFNC
jgi:hypothetical protein